jgi:hypothetical protein
VKYSTSYEDIIELYKQVNKNMPLNMAIDYRQDGIGDDLKLYLKCSMITALDEPTWALFLKITRAELE